MRRTPSHCAGCARGLVPQRAWQAMTPEERDTHPGRRHESRGLCPSCYWKLRRDDLLGQRRLRRADEVLEEWVLLRSDGVTDLGVAAKRIGMTRTALQQALYRARRRGDDRGRVHRNDQLSGGMLQGTTNIGQRRAA
jgi:hypothetical protein